MGTQHTATRGVAGTRIVAAGVEWDAVKVARYLGLQALSLLDQPGAVVVDPAAGSPVLYFLVPPRSTDGWNLPQTTALSEATYLVLPPAHREGPPGPYWLHAPHNGPLHTDAPALHAALTAVLGPTPAGPA